MSVIAQDLFILAPILSRETVLMIVAPKYHLKFMFKLYLQTDHF